MGRPLAVSEARARDDRGPGGPPRPGGSYGGRGHGLGGSRPARAVRDRGGFSGRPRGPRPGGGFGGPASRRRIRRPTARRIRRPGPAARQRTATGRERNFGPPAPPKGKKGAKGSFQQKERGPKGPIPTKFTGRMYDLDDVEKDDASADEVPEFMKPDDAEPEDEPDARRIRAPSREPDPATTRRTTTTTVAHEPRLRATTIARVTSRRRRGSGALPGRRDFVD